MKGIKHIALWAVVAAVLGLLLAGCGSEAASPAPASGQPPVVVIVAPAAGTTVQSGQTVAVQSQAIDDEGVVRVELWADGVLVRTDPSAQATGQTPFLVSQAWQPAVPGSHAVMVKAYDADGQVTQSSVLIVNVQDIQVALVTATSEPEPAASPQPTAQLPQPTAELATSEPAVLPTDVPATAVPPTATPKPPVDQAPKVQLLSPANPYVTSPGSEVTLHIKATDDKGVTRVELWVDGQLYRMDEVGGGKTVTWEMHWTPPALGTYTLEIKALDTKFKPSAVARLDVQVEQSEPPVDLPPPYDDLWAQMGGAAGALGMPVGDVVLRPAAGQEFERGYMIWRDNATGYDRIYAIPWGGSGAHWGQYDDTWVEGEPELSCGQAVLPNGPKRGFGKVWCANSAMRDALGAAIEVEVGYDGGWLDFENGVAVWDRRHDRAFVLLYSGEWQAVAVPAVP